MQFSKAKPLSFRDFKFPIWVYWHKHRYWRKTFNICVDKWSCHCVSHTRIKCLKVFLISFSGYPKKSSSCSCSRDSSILAWWWLPFCKSSLNSSKSHLEWIIWISKNCLIFGMFVKNLSLAEALPLLLSLKKENRSILM